MNPHTDRSSAISDIIRTEVRAVLASDAFQEWLGQERARAGDLLILNNSFLHREGIGNRSKSIKYLAVTLEADGQPSSEVSVVLSKNRILNRFKRVARTRISDYRAEPLCEAVFDELLNLGTIVFAIAGRIGDDTPVSVEIPDNTGMRLLEYAPTQREVLVILGDKISVNRIDDIDVV